jgi:hypothetical protein
VGDHGTEGDRRQGHEPREAKHKQSSSGDVEFGKRCVIDGMAASTFDS